MKLALFADGQVGLRITQFLVDSYLGDLALIVTTQKNEIHALAESRGLAVDLYDASHAVPAALADGVDLGVLAWWPKIIRNPLLAFPKHGFVNTHPSLLPHNRGKHYNFWTLVEQTPFGVTLHRVDEGVDTGEIVAQREIAYGWSDNGGSLYAKAQEAMVELFCSTYPGLRAGDFESTAQNSELASFHHSSEIESASRIDLDRLYSARDILNLLRARTFAGHPGCQFEDIGDHFEVSIEIKKVQS
ncbi:MAG: formyl transferase [Polaromonas sp.]|uniref:formyltransferase family protein n=1 Tax=Polaromonas sp. TaxID=1869339 RepID=UPI0017ACECAE|nr:formyltransferase family protein [Polaromonas sp.]NMM11427.1 formyl transferase [Polaromonas sp.]